MKIGLVRHFYETDLKAQAEMAASIDAAMGTRFPKAGRDRRRSGNIRRFLNMPAVNRVILLSEILQSTRNGCRRPEDYAHFTQRLMPSAFIRATHYVQAMQLPREDEARIRRNYALLRLCLNSVWYAGRLSN